MIKALMARLKQGYRTFPFQEKLPAMPDRFRGLPKIDAARCPAECTLCAEACPTGAITTDAAHKQFKLDLGRCLFCEACSEACTAGALQFSNQHSLAARTREDLTITPEKTWQAAQALEEKSRKLFGRSLRLRQVSAGGCNACEADVNVLTTLTFDLGQYGIQFVAAPRHADGLLITGPVPVNMRLALKKTYEAVPQPKIVIATGACAISGGPYRDQAEVSNGADGLVPVDLYIPGCPPHPYTILDGLLRLLGRLDRKV